MILVSIFSYLIIQAAPGDPIDNYSKPGMTKEQIEIALKEYERLGSVQAVINLLEYPSSSTLYRWYERKLAEKTNYRGSLE